MRKMVAPFLEEVAQNFRIVDALDILFVAALLYGAMLWFNQAASRSALIGVAALIGLYFVSRALDMFLTSLVFQTSFAVLLFALVVVFQEDLRRLFERLSALRSMSLGRSPSADIDFVDDLVEAAFRLAAEKTGSLIVVRGAEPLARHLDSGVPLGGKVSTPLLYSIFDTHTAGHDGAAILDGDRVVQFAAHLPISKNTAAIAGRGTRHAAALGLSERSDALTVVVSEERGVVSVAEAGKLTEVPTAAELKSRLESHLATTSPEQSPPLARHILLQHGRLKFLALTVAVVAWFALAYDPDTVQRTFVAPIEYRNLASQLVLDQSAPNEARLTLSGSERSFRFLEPSNLKITLDLSDVQPGYHEFPISDGDLRIPVGLTPYRIAPRPVRLFVEKRQADAKPVAEP